ncbi:hypothetical protein CL6EHI_072950 [Entamoeba histolytica]|uniref:Uncharacterized protein n=2 Tax=Entamoeba histolytica TaxID=5759 RepID=B1N5S8_ENTH1|nr:hypothetical protein EHI_072950 [Entamoeba histolytica HM-1:IMSS]EDS88680.1 hypothetical protein EHI_072950 [Entamoeba histolytica HM-1:IMSS]GAT99632.1 hypothetical protein CL6EHI_072950 [Entamoeba histolytica]|eukprot:XP_001914543.1 hypothetical protein EHI_072950 [Entamoeba histolytica HM-1:IMSS]
MEAIGSKYLNKNNILTTRYFNNNTFYLDTIKTTDGITTINVKNITTNEEIDEMKEKMKETNTYINDIRDDVSQLSTLNTTNMNEINNLTNQLISLSSLVNTSLYSPFYSNEEALLKMTSLTSYINTEISRNTTIKQADIINTIGIKDLKNITYTFPLSTLMSWGTDSSKTFKNTSTDHKMYIFQFMFMINTDTDSTKKTKIYFNSNRIDAGNSSTIDKLSDRDKYYSNGYMIFTTKEYVSTVGVYILNYTDGTLTYKNAVDIVQSSPNQSFIYYIDSKTPFDVWNDEEIKR